MTSEVEYDRTRRPSAERCCTEGTALGSDDPVTRFCEMLRLLNESHLLIDTLYGLFRREPVTAIDRSQHEA